LLLLRPHQGSVHSRELEAAQAPVYVDLSLAGAYTQYEVLTVERNGRHRRRQPPAKGLANTRRPELLLGSDALTKTAVPLLLLLISRRRRCCCYFLSHRFAFRGKVSSRRFTSRASIVLTTLFLLLFFFLCRVIVVETQSLLDHFRSLRFSEPSLFSCHAL
jgi:hypothetical protein